MEILLDICFDGVIMAFFFEVYYVHSGQKIDDFQGQNVSEIDKKFVDRKSRVFVLKSSILNLSNLHPRVYTSM